MSSLILCSERVALADGVRPAAVQIRDGRIGGIVPYGERSAGIRIIDAGSHVILPGLVDTHVHINEPGRTEWEGFDHATRAAAAGGVTTIIDMPLNSVPPTTTVTGLEAKRAAAGRRCYVDVGFWGGVVPGNVDDIEPLARAGVFGFKCFLSPSGVPEFGNVDEEDLRIALPVVARLRLPLLVHAELPALLRDPLNSTALDRSTGRTDPRTYRNWLESRPSEAETAAIDLMVRLGREYGARIHIVHLATRDALPMLSAARRDGIVVTVETCPHYLTFSSEEIPDGATAYKCAPPIRERSHREGLWNGLVAGEIDFVASDHSPSPPSMKLLDEGDFVRAWGGIASLQVGLAVMWSRMKAAGLSIDRLARWLAAAPASLAGLDRQKGSIAVGGDADLVIWDPDASCTIDAATLFHRHPVTPYDGVRVQGEVKTTFVRGEVVFDQGKFVGLPRGCLLSRKL